MVSDMSTAAKKENLLVPQTYAGIVLAGLYLYVAYAFGWRWSLGAMALLSAATAASVYLTERRLGRAGATTRHHVLAGLLFGALALVLPQWSLPGYHLWTQPLFVRATSWLHTRVVAPVLFPVKKAPHDNNNGPSFPTA
jgi:hypothetical protein